MTTEEELQRQGDLLNALIREASEEDKLFTVGYGMRAAAILHSQTLGYTLPEGKKAVQSIWDSYFAVRQMYGLHVDQEWSAYYRKLPFWKKYKAYRNEYEWKRNRRIQLENEAETAVLSIIDDIDYRRIYEQEL